MPLKFFAGVLPFTAVSKHLIGLAGAKWFAAFCLVAAVAAGWSTGGPVAGVIIAGLIGIILR